MKHKCICCGNELVRSKKVEWHFECHNCGYERAFFDNKSSIIDSANIEINEEERRIGLENLRKKNFYYIVEKVLLKYKKQQSSLLDVGCGHGWFLKAAAKYYNVVGIEPDVKVASFAKESGLPIREGYFPDAIIENEKFDIITFNDVFEHIEDVKTVVKFCYKHLQKDGVLLINIPVNSGFLYCLSKFLMKMGYDKYFNRMWQKSFPFPHYHYFNENSIRLLLEANGFLFLESFKIKSVSIMGLYERIKYSKEFGLLIQLVTFFFIILLYPILYLKSDTKLFVFKMS